MKETVKIGAITIGQAPRVDMTGDMKALLGENLTLVEFGALDNYTLEQATAQFSPKPGDEVLVTRMRDGQQVIIAEKYVTPLLQECIDKAEAQGVRAIILLCTGSFPPFRHSVLLIKPQPLFHGTAQKLAEGRKIGVIVPDESQLPQVMEWWAKSGVNIEAIAASPYLAFENVENAAKQLCGKDLAFICMDCMGYTVEMKKRVSEITGLPVILPRTLVARIADELYWTL